MQIHFTTIVTLLITFAFFGNCKNFEEQNGNNFNFNTWENLLKLSKLLKISENSSHGIAQLLHELPKKPFLTRENFRRLDLRALAINGTSNLAINGTANETLTGKATAAGNEPQAKPFVMPPLSPTCAEQMMMLQGSMSEQWAIKMFDAMGKPLSGIADGAFHWLGSYDECRRVKQVSSKKYPNVTSFDGKMCSVNMPLNQISTLKAFFGDYPVSLDADICLPDSCNKMDAFVIFNQLLGMTGVSKYGLYATPKDCYENHKELDNLAIACIAVCGVIGFLLICGTIYDGVLQWNKSQTLKSDTIHISEPSANKYTIASESKTMVTNKQPGILANMLLSFSVYTNAVKLMSAKKSSGNLGAINGIRFLSISWVILGHSFLFVMGTNNNIVYFYPHFLKRWTSLGVVNALVSVDSFFALSGLLVSYLFLKELKKNDGPGRINWFMFYFHRFWRLTPPYMLVVFVYMSLLRYWGDGPMWPKDGIEHEQCVNNWWTNLVYLNNFIHADKQCLSWSWYLANDMQFYILSPLMIVPLYYSKVAGSIMCFIFVLVNFVSSGVITKVNDYPPLQNTLNPKPATDYFSVYYVKPYCRIGPYAVGIFTGYLLYKWKCKCNINKYVNVIIWVVTFVLTSMILYGTYDVVKGNQMDTDVSALYTATHRTVWGACVCWVIFACVTGNGGIINEILSWQAFIPLARLSYCAYLVHLIISFIFLGNSRQSYYLNDVNMVCIILCNVVASFAGAFITSLAFESPMMGIEKALFRRGARK